jgi:hypothetical protein
MHINTNRKTSEESLKEAMIFLNDLRNKPSKTASDKNLMFLAEIKIKALKEVIKKKYQMEFLSKILATRKK